ncbi:hydroxyacylglutathione hydrolase [Cognatishimia activa]|uniref:hydroxyacylglutathione hydrolase n=1 Tax=Cognatishimia activa TaxID=1715691 RepID=UPI00222E6F56|nr:hydroxyacylglutathione hydrolase [Cognatishimia activa]UZD91241.1 hydroxyacylglutathione hydrolase [Cognatishimia activa]
MPFEIVTIPCLEHNYAFLLHDGESDTTVVIDVPEAALVSDALKSQGWTLTHVMLTHHHGDHTGGVAELLSEYPATVIGGAADEHRLPLLDQAVSDGDVITLGAESVEVLDVSGHTRGHIAYYFPKTGAVATADSLMALGCGRVYGDGPEQMYASLQKLAALPPETLVLSGHEFTEKNAAFALTIDSTNDTLIARAAEVKELRSKGQPTIPTTLSDELATNPFLRCDNAQIRQTLGMEDATSVEVFAEIRERKDKF